MAFVSRNSKQDSSLTVCFSEYLPKAIDNQANLVAIYSRSRISAQSLLEVAEAKNYDTSMITIYSDDSADQNLDKLVSRADVGAVMIALPILAQPDVIRKCLAAGKHVLSEKPVAKDYNTGAALVSEYEAQYASKSLVWMVGEQFRYDLGLAKARQLIQSGNIGELTSVHARAWAEIKPGNKYYETAWRKHPEYQGGFILDGGVHFVALLQYVSGQDIIATKSFTKQVAAHLPPMDTVNAAVKYRNGAQGCISISLASKKTEFEFFFMGSEGTLVLKFMGKIGLKLEDSQGQTKLEETIDGQAVSEEIQAFFRAISGSSIDSKNGLREALSDLAVVESICSGGGDVPNL